MKKYCPLKFKHHSADWYCEEGDCAWYDCDAGLCDIVTIAAALASMADTYAVSEQPLEHEASPETEASCGH